MNILLLTTHLNIGGIASYIVNLAKRLKRKGHKVVVSSSGGDMVDELTKEDIPHVYINIRTKSELSPKLLISMPKVLSLIKDEKIDVIHAHTRVTQVLASAVSRLLAIPYIATCHGFFRPHFSRRIFKCWGDKTIAISDAVKAHLIDDFYLKPDNIALIYNGVDLEKFRKDIENSRKESLRKNLGLTDKERVVIGAIGRLSPVKGYRYLIEAFKRLMDKDSGALRLLIVGDGPERESLKAQCLRLGVDEYVKFASPNPDTPLLFSIIDIFVSSSVQEGLGLSLIEALASGSPVVATDVGGIKSVVKDKETGMLVRPKEAGALAEGISQLLKSADLRNKLSNEGRKYAEEKFDIKNMADEVERVYKEVTKRDPRPVRPVGSNGARILIVNVNWLGDVLFTTPFIKAIRRRFPASYMACMVVPRCKEILEDNPRIDEIIIYDEKGKHRSIMGKLKFIITLKRKNFSTAYILHRSFTKALMVYLSGIKRRIGYNTKRRGPLLTKAIDETDPGIHKVEYFLKIAASCGAETGDKDYEFFVKRPQRDKIDKLLRDRDIRGTDIIVALNPGGNWPPKRWPKEHFAELADRLSRELNVKAIITGAPKDLKLAQDIIDLSQTRPASACGQTSIKELAALLERSNLVISSDSGPMHIALSVKTKVITLFGPTSEEITGPYGRGNYLVIKKDVGCPVPCYNFDCRDYKCMKAVTVDEVFNKAREILFGSE
ncbi:MAG: lipopolysaccharide heptosyltransferase II [Candidatus Omnitrophica bacterium]|nr:lipopolysaccharide heptosyltransferase II [Candidatus Omnitrophota bacterium]